MKRTPLTRKTPLKSNARLKQTKGLRHTTLKTAHRNAQWRSIIMERAKYLIEKYGFLICEYSGETITVLSSVPDDMNEGWGHHINKNRADCQIWNCYIVKYKYHSQIHDNNIEVHQEDFQGEQQ
jgi:hypothetical protein